MTDDDREQIAVLSTRLSRAEEDIQMLIGGQKDLDAKVSQASVSMAGINGKLDSIIQSQKDHARWHNDNEARGFNWVSLILPIVVTISIFIFGYLDAQNTKNMQREIVEQVQKISGGSK